MNKDSEIFDFDLPDDGEKADWGFLDHLAHCIEVMQAKASQPPRKMVHYYLFHGRPEDIENMDTIEILARSSYLGRYPEEEFPS